MSRIGLTAFILVAAHVLNAQAPPPASSPVPQASLMRTKAEMERELDTLVQGAATAKSNGSYASATEILEDALHKVRGNPLLKEHENDVLVRLGYTYMGSQRLDDSMRIFTGLLTPQKHDCKTGSAAIELCADAQYGLGTVQMYKGEFEGAVGMLTKSMASYAKASAGDHTEEFRMIKVKQQADVEALLGAALFRTGKKEKAIDALHHAVSQFTVVESNDKIPESVRAGARTSMKDAQTSLDLLLKN
jgi:tetratricopeptide (TPR) repeat protein